MERKKESNNQSNFEKKNKYWGIAPPGVKTNYEPTVIRITCHWQMDQWDRREHANLDPHKYGPLTFEKDIKAIQWIKDDPFNKWDWNNYTYLWKKTSS